MATANVEIAQQAVDAFRARDGNALRRLFHPDGEFKSAIVGGVEGVTYRGHEDIDRYLADLDEVMDDWHTEDERFLDAGPEKVILLYRIVGKGKGSGVPIDQSLALVFSFRRGKIERGEIYLDPKEALEAAGVSGEAG